MDPLKVEFRTATLADSEELFRLVNSAYRGEGSKVGWTTEADLLGGLRTDVAGLNQMMAEPGNAIVLCLCGQTPVGCVFLKRKPESCYLGMLTVTPGLQASGLGRLILTEAENRARNWSLSRMEMNVITQRQELLAWYERRGYSRTGRREPFPYGDVRFGEPKVDDLEFEVLEKYL